MREENFINVREFLRNYKKFKNKTYIIANHGKPELVVMPYKKWKENQIPIPKFVRFGKNKKNKKLTLLDAIEKFTFSGSGDSDLSQKIDEIVYGAPNPYRKNEDS